MNFDMCYKCEGVEEDITPAYGSPAYIYQIFILTCLSIVMFESKLCLAHY